MAKDTMPLGRPKRKVLFPEQLWFRAPEGTKERVEEIALKLGKKNGSTLVREIVMDRLIELEGST